MATKARIGYLSKNNSAKTIEVAYEGYPEYTGKLLKKHFKTSKALKELLQKGDIIELKANLKEIEHDDLQGDALDHRFVGSLDQLGEDTWAEYIYIFKENDKAWYILTNGQVSTL